MSSKTRSDCLITEADIETLKVDVFNGSIKEQVFDAMTREPELAIFSAQEMADISDDLERAGIRGKQKAGLEQLITLAIWEAVVLVSRAHRRQWDGFLSSEKAIDEGGAQ
jgi:hypothetical protein